MQPIARTPALVFALALVLVLAPAFGVGTNAAAQGDATPEIETATVEATETAEPTETAEVTETVEPTETVAAAETPTPTSAAVGGQVADLDLFAFIVPGTCGNLGAEAAFEIGELEEPTGTDEAVGEDEEETGFAGFPDAVVVLSAQEIVDADLADELLREDRYFSVAVFDEPTGAGNLIACGEIGVVVEAGDLAVAVIGQGTNFFGLALLEAGVEDDEQAVIEAEETEEADVGDVIEEAVPGEDETRVTVYLYEVATGGGGPVAAGTPGVAAETPTAVVDETPTEEAAETPEATEAATPVA